MLEIKGETGERTRSRGKPKLTDEQEQDIALLLRVTCSCGRGYTPCELPGLVQEYCQVYGIEAFNNCLPSKPWVYAECLFHIKSRLFQFNFCDANANYGVMLGLILC